SVIGRAQVLMSLGSVYLDMSVLNEQLLEELKGVCSDPQNPKLFKVAEDITTDRATALASMVMQEAKICLDQAEDSLRQVGEKEKSLLRANIFNQRGNLLAAQKKNAEALAAYQESAKLAKDTDKVLAAKTSVNYIQVMLTNQENCELAVPNFKEVLPELRKLPDSHDKVFTLLGLAALFKPSKVDSSQKPEKQPSCSLSNEKDGLRLSAIQEALEVAKKLEDKTAMAYAYGYLAQLYAEQKRYDDAIQLTRQAIFYAQDSGRFYVNPTATAWPGQSVAYVQSYPRSQSEFISYPEQLFRWEWQLGKFLHGQEKLSEAVATYDSAVKHLRLTRRFCGSISPTFGKEVEKFANEWVLLLIQSVNNEQNSEKRKEFLNKLVGSVELFKKSELQNYFQDYCLAESESKDSDQILSLLPDDVAVFYPILLKDGGEGSVELLLVSSKGIRLLTKHLTETVTVKTLTDTVDELRNEIDRIANTKFMRDIFKTPDLDNSEKIDKEIKKQLNSSLDETVKPRAQKLYQWLVKPLVEVLKNQEPKVSTLLVVPDGRLRTIPFSMLYDGDNQKFLIEDYALAVIPGLTLTALGGVKFRSKPQGLLSGLSEPIPSLGLPGLQAQEELNDIAAVENLWGSKEPKRLERQLFTISGLETELKANPYSIIHLATHGQFKSNPQDTFLVTYDFLENNNKRLTMDVLQTLMSIPASRGKPIELLTLSACQSARGDEKAALGMAGVAIKVGVNSVVGTLWIVQNQTTRELMQYFYENLGETKFKTKAKALQEAQKKLLNENKGKMWDHPYYWAPLLLIGNWL
ncbi:MAG: hypothetical protein BWK78_03540, partial [Thiotrichaceae bacterium IS1]